MYLCFDQTIKFRIRIRHALYVICAKSSHYLAIFGYIVACINIPPLPMPQRFWFSWHFLSSI